MSTSSMDRLWTYLKERARKLIDEGRDVDRRQAERIVAEALRRYHLEEAPPDARAFLANQLLGFIDEERR